MSDLVAERVKVKKDVRSLLISAPNGLTPKMLEKDYHELTGRPLPYRQFGYFTSVDFARSLTDILKVTQRNNETILFGIADESTEHILKMVKRQKNPKFYSSMVRRNPPNSKQNSQRKPYNANACASAFTRSGILKVLEKHSNGIPLTKLPHLYKELNGVDLGTFDSENIASVITNMSDIAKLEFGRQDRFGNNLYVYPSSSSTYKSLVENKICLGDSAESLRTKQKSSLSSFKRNSSCVSINTQVTTSTSVLSNLSTCTTVQTSSSVTTSSAWSHPKTSHSKWTDGRVSESTNSLNRLNNRSLEKINQKLQSVPHSSFSHDTVSEKSTSWNTSHASKNKCSSSAVEDYSESKLMAKSFTPHSSLTLQDEILQLLEGYSNGICSVKVPTLYKEKYKKDLELSKYGYFSVIDFLATMTDKLNMCRLNRTGDWMVKLKNSVPEKSIDNSNLSHNSSGSNADLSSLKEDLKELLEKYKSGLSISSLQDIFLMHFNRPLPIREFGLNSAADLICIFTDKLVLCGDGTFRLQPSTVSELSSDESSIKPAPIDAVGQGVCYNPPTIPTVDWGFFDCYVAHVTSPGRFSIQVIDEKESKKFDDLMDKLAKAYTHPSAKDYRMPTHMARVGQICVAIFHGDNNWNRAIITEEPMGGFVQVLYVDYGDVASVSISSLYLLKSEFQDFPALMVQARLSYLRPLDLKAWTVEAKRVMLDITRNKKMVAKVTSVDEDSGILSLWLCDTTLPDEDIYVNDVLLQRKLALHVNDDASPRDIEMMREQIEKKQEIERLQRQSLVPYQESISTNKEDDLPSEAPPPYQANETMSQTGSSGIPVIPSQNCETRKTVRPPPGFHQNRKVTIPSANDSVVESKQISGPGKSSADTFMSKKSRSLMQQRRFLQRHYLSDDIKIHVINYEGNALISSGEISHLFRPKSEDVLVPLLLIKGLTFPELVLDNSANNAMLFAEFAEMQVKGTVNNNGVRPLVTLYRLTDVPNIVDALNHENKDTLKIRLIEIIGSFEPDSPYWYSSTENTLDNPTDFLQSSATNPQTDDSLRKSLEQQKETLLSRLMSNSSPTLVKELEDVLKQLSLLEEPGNLCADEGADGKITITEEEDRLFSCEDMCTIPNQQAGPMLNIFTNINYSSNNQRHGAT